MTRQSLPRLTSKTWTNHDPFPEELKGVWKVSASQIKTYDRCARKWGFKYLEGIPDPPGAAAKLGSAVHKVLEDFLNDGTQPDTSTREGKIATAGLELYPEDPDVEVELEIFFVADGVLYRGFIDAVWAHDPPKIKDHKTSSDPAKWGLNAKQLVRDPQGLIYGTFGLDHWDSQEVELGWVYYKTRGRSHAFPVEALLSRELAIENFEALIAPIGKAITTTRQQFVAGEIKGAKDLEANTQACGDFKGCPYAEFCKRSPKELLSVAFGPPKKEKEKDMGLKEMLEAKQKKSAPPKKGSAEYNKVVSINAPEGPKDPKVAREISKAIGKTTGNAKKKKEKAREIANAAQGAQTPEEAEAAAQSALEIVEEDSKNKTKSSSNKSPTGDEILEMVGNKIHRFAKTRSQESEDHPFAHGRTLNKLSSDGLINFKEMDGLRVVMPTDAGKARIKELQGLTVNDTKALEALTDAVSSKTEQAKFPKTEPRFAGEDENGSDVYENVLTHAEVFCRLLVANNVKEAKARFEAFCEVFPR